MKARLYICVVGIAAALIQTTLSLSPKRHRKQRVTYGLPSRFFPLICILLFVYTLVGEAFADTHFKKDKWSYSLDYIRGEGDVEGIKLALQYHSDWIKQYNEKLNLYVESSVNFWEYGSPTQYDTNFVIALSPVIHYPFGEWLDQSWYGEFGIGVSLINETQFAGKNIGSHYQFEDRIGIVTKFGEKVPQQIALRYFHYSNAGLKKPNPGLDFISLSYTRFFK